MRRWVGGWIAAAWSLAVCAAAAPAPAPAPAPSALTLEQALGYPFVSGLVAAEHADRIAWVQDVRGVRNVWVADGPAFRPRQVTRYAEDDGQELTGLTFSPDGSRLLYVRGGDHDANWAADGKLAPNPADNPDEPKVTIWSASPDAAAAPVKLAEGDFPALSARGVLAYVKDDQVWTTALDGHGKPERLAFDRGKARSLVWSPDGSRLAFVSDRGDHAFVAVYTDKAHPLVYLQPSTGRDDDPAWSPDGSRIAFTRQPGAGGAPEPLLTRTPHPFALWTADASTGAGVAVWRSPNTLDGSYPEAITGVNLLWAADGRLGFTADLDGWRHLYAVSAAGGAPTLLTPGHFMVEDVALTKDKRSLVYSANTGANMTLTVGGLGAAFAQHLTPGAGDDDRRHVFCVALAGGAPTAVTSGDAIQTAPVPAADNRVAFVDWGARRPAEVEIASLTGAGLTPLDDAAVRDYPSDALVVPRLVSFRAADGTALQGQLFQRDDGLAAKPGVIFVHGGPPRQMLLGWHYMGYYSNAYATNQYLAAHGFVVLSVNYRLGIGYGRAFQQPDHAGYAGASEYQDVLAAARFLQGVAGVDPNRIGIWGGSYGGYLTGLALARNSDLFKAGVDFHGVHDWSTDLEDWVGAAKKRYEQGDRAEAMRVAFQSSPDADVKTWRSPVLLIQGDDDRNVHFSETVDLTRRLDAQGVRHEELVIPNEIHGFLRYASWLEADRATAAFLTRELGAR